MAIKRWFDLAAHGYYVGAERLGDGVPRMLLLDVEDKADPSKLLVAGFMPMRGSPAYDRGLYYFGPSDQRIRGQALAAALGLPRIPMIDKEGADIAREFRAAFRQKIGKNLGAALQQARKIGHNKDGHPVYDSPTGRFMQRSGAAGVPELVSAESTAGREMGVGSFLYGEDAQSLAECADGFFGEIRAGVRMNWTDLERYARAAFERHLIDGEVLDGQLRAFQEAVEAAGYRAFFNREAGSIDKRLLSIAESYYNGLPVARMRTGESIALQQYSTPLPMGVVAQRLLVGNDRYAGKTVLEPTGGNGGLVTLVNKQADVYSLELDGKRASVLKANGITTMVGDAVELDYRAVLAQPEGFDYSITNPPFGEMDRDRPFGVLPRVKRADYYIALKTLDARKPEGRSVLILGGDDQRNPGAIRGGTKAFLEYVYDHYEVHGAVELDGRMYSKQGAGANVRMFVVGERRDAVVRAEIPERFEVLRTYAETWDWAETIVDRYPRVEAATEVEVVAVQPVGDAPVQAAPGVEATAGVPVRPAPAQPAVERRVNEYQAPYQSASRVAPPTGMVPINLAGATYAALADLEQRHGQIDKFVADKLQYKEADLAALFSPEQIDALGLAISKVDGGRAFTNSDFTGFGKGRFCAAMMRYAKLEGKVPVFLTLKPELFTDIFRDLKDIESDHLFTKPFIFNEGVSVMRFGSGSEVLHAATSPGERKAALDSGVLPEGVDLVLATYSQFQRRPEVNRKAGLLGEIAKQGTTFVIDEAHVAAGESNISAAIGVALEWADSVVFASATPFKGAANFRVYGRMFPSSVDLKNLPETLRAGGEALMEAISANMARDGVFIRRELDLSKLEFGARVPSAERTAFNRQTSDAVAVILSRMSYLSGDVRTEVNEMNKEFKKEFESIPEADREGRRMQANSMNFGSRLYNINRQFLLSLVVNEAADAAIEALEQGRKPVIAVENTGESLLREVLARRAGINDLIEEMERIKNDPELDKAAASERLVTLNDRVSRQLASVKLEQPPQFRDLLEVMLDRIGVIKVQERYGVYSTRQIDSEEYLEEQEAIRGLIRELPDMPLSALDVINQRLRDSGYDPTEVSGRTTSLTKDAIGGGWTPSEHKKANAVANVAGFQNGTHDCITITRAGSTGISLHATNRFEDSDIRQREFIVAQKAANIAEYLQWMGRVNRRDQVSHPIMRSLETNLPAEARLTMMHNSKLRRLSANTTSNRDNSNIEGEDLDFLNDVGDQIALEWLVENPSIARQLDIELPKDQEEALAAREQEYPYINKLMGRLVMVETNRQDEILATLSRRFADKIQELEEQGINPFKVDVYDWNAKVAAVDELVSPTLKVTTSTFDHPVNILKLHYEEEVVPVRQERLVEMIGKGWSEYREAIGDDEIRAKFREALGLHAERYITEQLPDELREKVRHGDLAMSDAVNMDGANNAKRADSRMRYLISSWPMMRPGALVEYEDRIRGQIKGYVTDVSLPRKADELTMLSAYGMRVVFPGESRPKALSLATLLNQDKFLNGSLRIDPSAEGLGIPLWQKRDFDELMSEYNDAPDGKVTRSAMVLSGNIFRSVELASQNKLGHPILYTDEQGNRQRAVLVKSHISAEKIKSMPMGMDDDDVVAYVRELDSGRDAGAAPAPFPQVAIYDNPLKEGAADGGVSIRRLGQDRYQISLPGTKSKAGSLLADGRIFDLGAKSSADSLRLALTGTRKAMHATVDATQLPKLLSRIREGGHFGKFYVADLNMEIVKRLQDRNRIEAVRTAGHDERVATLAPG